MGNASDLAVAGVNPHHGFDITTSSTPTMAAATLPSARPAAAYAKDQASELGAEANGWLLLTRSLVKVNPRSAKIASPSDPRSRSWWGIAR
jgi:hypothetical protein